MSLSLYDRYWNFTTGKSSGKSEVTWLVGGEAGVWAPLVSARATALIHCTQHKSTGGEFLVERRDFSYFTVSDLPRWVLSQPSMGIPGFIVLRRYCILLHIEGLGQPRFEQVYLHHFSNSICSLHVSVSHFCNSHSISKFYHVLWSVISGLQCYHCNCFGAPQTMQIR